MSILSDTSIAIFAGALATKIAPVGLAIARAFGVEAATAELANPIGIAIGAAILGAMVINKILPASVKSQGPQARTEFDQNKAKGVADIATLFGNVVLSTVNAGISKLPGHPGFPLMKLPFTPSTNTGVSGGVGSNYGVVAPKGKVIINNKHVIKGKK